MQGLLGKKVRVYRNLHTGNFSIQHKGRVIAHLPSITLTAVTFTVQPAGRAKVLATKQKQVHAYVNGTVAPDAPAPTARASYNPYKAGTFTTTDGQPVTAAHTAVLTQGAVFFN
ncbi:hypothetical protein [Hymenobacter koreensis]|uniref:Uncharacterized protein n=1 Tax=Hymenobacter koreensis TaxID=1084523 RepID=A0ABP8JK98_9BACT